MRNEPEMNDIRFIQGHAIEISRCDQLRLLID